LQTPIWGSSISKLREKVIEMIKSEKISTKDDNEKEHLKAIGKMFENSMISSMFTNLGNEPNPYAAGVDFKMMIDKNLKYICPPEDADLNKRAFETMKKRETAESEYNENWLKADEELQQNSDYLRADSQIDELRKKGEANLTDEERRRLTAAREVFSGFLDGLENDPRVKPLRERLDQAKAEEKYAIFTAREGEILRKIDFYDQQDLVKGKTLGDRLVIYGANHDLTEELEAWNGKNSPETIHRGLIKFNLKK